MRLVILGMLALSPPVFAQTTAEPKPPLSGCNTPQQAQFDFWVGEWDVFPYGKETQVASSKIEKLYNGCAIRENWMPKKGSGGGSLSNFDPRSGRWQQVWIGSQAGRVEFDGGFTDGKMVLTGNWPNVLGPGRDALIRMTYSRESDGSVRQLGEQSVDQGLTWGPSFDFIYRRKKSEAKDSKGTK